MNTANTEIEKPIGASHHIVRKTTAREIGKEKRRKIREIISSVILWIIGATIIFFVVSGLYTYFFNKENYTGFFGIGCASIVSESMEPTLKVADVIIYKAVEPATLKADEKDGDIIVYKRQDSDGVKLIVHRLIGYSNGLLITRGDATTISDEPFSADLVVGKCITYIPRIGFLCKVISSSTAVYIAIALIIIMIISEIYFVEAGKKEMERCITPNKKQQKAFREFFKN